MAGHSYMDVFLFELDTSFKISHRSFVEPSKFYYSVYLFKYSISLEVHSSWINTVSPVLYYAETTVSRSCRNTADMLYAIADDVFPRMPPLIRLIARCALFPLTRARYHLLSPLEHR